MPIMNFNNKQTMMKRQINEQNSIKITPSGFCFKYFINLGEDRYGSMTINQKTNLYEQAQKFCKNYQLQPYVAVYLENQMFQEVLRVKQEMALKVNNGTNRASNGCISAGKIIKNNMYNSFREGQKLFTQTQVTQSNHHTQNKIKKLKSSVSILNHQQDLKKSYRVETQSVSQRKAKKVNYQHFEEMFRRHQQIQNKKQLSRKASLQKIPFKPTINNLSRKIVDLKRNTMNSKFNQKSIPTQKVYINKKQSTVSEKQNKQLKKQTKNTTARNSKTIHTTVEVK